MKFLTQEQYNARLKEFREDDQARWKYEEQEIQRRLAILKAMGRSDQQFKTELQRAGINVAALEEDADKELQKWKRAHEEISKITPPPPRRGRKDRLILDQIAAMKSCARLTIPGPSIPDIDFPGYPRPTVIYPPASFGYGTVEYCGINLALGEINIAGSLTGDGWGWTSTASSPHYCVLIFHYVPPRAGNILFQPHIDFQGTVVLNAHDHWYTSTHARLKMKLHYDLHQHYWDGEQVMTLIDEHGGNINTAYWFEEHLVLSKTLSVSAGDVVTIKLQVSVDAHAQSSHAHVDYDFRTGSDKYIRVETIVLSYI